MMMRLTKSALMAIATGTLALSSCSNEKDYYDENYKKEQYAANWEAQFGKIDPNQDWNMATRVTAKVNLAGLEQAANVSVYTAMPGGKNCQIVATYPATTKNFSFDYVKGAKDAYVLVTDNSGKVLLGNYFTISNGELTIGANTKSSRAGDCATAIGEQIVPIDDNGFYDGNSLWDSSLYPYFTNEWDHQVKYSKAFPLYSLTGVKTTEGSSVKISDIAEIVGKGGVFAEQGIDADRKCNLLHWEDQLKPSEGAEYVMESDGPLELTFMFGGTDKKNKYGYLYYKDGASVAEILSAPHYILMEDASPQGNVKVDGAAIDDGMRLPGLVQSYEDYGGNDVILTGTTYKLAYFDEQGNSSFTFPAGTHIVFFEIIDANNKINPDGTPYYDAYFTEMRYSLPWMNRYYYRPHNESHPNWEALDASRNFVTYKWNGQTVLGLEDEGGDHDMNDILFSVNGDFDSSEIVEIGDDPEEQTWILACEDLGSTDDFDFNDVVFSVSHVSGKETAKVTALAAGGTLPSVVYYGDTKLDEIHESFGVSSNDNGTYEMINTGSGLTKSASVMASALAVPADFSIGDDMGGFKVITKQEGGDETSVNVIAPPAEGTAPQMICVPGSWYWPKERVNIKDAYSKFNEYGAWKEAPWWYDSPNNGKVMR